MAEKKIMGKYEKLMIVQQTLKAPKNQYNSFGKYNYRSCEDILEGLKPCLKEVNACVTVDDEVVQIGDHYYIKAQAMFIDCDTGELVCNTAYAREPESKAGMDQAQITGATSSYARKYALNGLFMIDDNKDADTDEQANETRARSTKSKTTEQKTTEQKTQDVSKQCISETKQKALSNKCETEGVHPTVILDKCHVHSFAELTEKQLAWICANWSKEFKNA
jgi:glucan-binding YG repeat protein